MAKSMKPEGELQKPVELHWRPEEDPRRLRRVAEVLADIMDASQQAAPAAAAEEAIKR